MRDELNYCFNHAIANYLCARKRLARKHAAKQNEPQQQQQLLATERDQNSEQSRLIEQIKELRRQIQQLQEMQQHEQRGVDSGAEETWIVISKS